MSDPIFEALGVKHVDPGLRLFRQDVEVLGALSANQTPLSALAPPWAPPWQSQNVDVGSLHDVEADKSRVWLGELQRDGSGHVGQSHLQNGEKIWASSCDKENFSAAHNTNIPRTGFSSKWPQNVQSALGTARGNSHQTFRLEAPEFVPPEAVLRSEAPAFVPIERHKLSKAAPEFIPMTSCRPRRRADAPYVGGCHVDCGSLLFELHEGDLNSPKSCKSRPSSPPSPPFKIPYPDEPCQKNELMKLLPFPKRSDSATSLGSAQTTIASEAVGSTQTTPSAKSVEMVSVVLQLPVPAAVAKSREIDSTMSDNRPREPVHQVLPVGSGMTTALDAPLQRERLLQMRKAVMGGKRPDGFTLRTVSLATSSKQSQATAISEEAFEGAHHATSESRRSRNSARRRSGPGSWVR